jgi:hypothetical protein
MNLLAPIFPVESGSGSEVSQRLPKLLAEYIQYHRVEGSTLDTLKHKNKELRPFIRQLEPQGHSLIAENVTLFDILGHLESLKLWGSSLS